MTTRSKHSHREILVKESKRESKTEARSGKSVGQRQLWPTLANPLCCCVDVLLCWCVLCCCCVAVVLLLLCVVLLCVGASDDFFSTKEKWRSVMNQSPKTFTQQARMVKIALSLVRIRHLAIRTLSAPQSEKRTCKGACSSARQDRTPPEPPRLHWALHHS